MSEPRTVRDVVDEVWNPTQHVALWLGAWVTGHEQADFVLDALGSLGRRHEIDLSDAWVPDVAGDGPVGAPAMLRLVRAVADGGSWGPEDVPPVRLVLSGPGDVPALPAGTDCARAAAEAGAAIVVADAEPGWHHVLVPRLRRDASGPLVRWRWFTIEGPLPAPAHLSPGEADLMLADATRDAARLIAAAHPGGHAQSASSGFDPRLTVGALTDHFDLMAMPTALPRRAGGVLARADRVAAILAVAAGGDHGAVLDPHLVPLWRPVRLARMAAVEHAVREWAGAF
ncbi:hypothetical protein [Corynebacterium sp.]|uniref:hypothetical protein n=1 Tax=Corynebacterium sp. TaxID=1720 RepID=UPI0026DB134A|nr:hypothetical protein [Corynebacterium sp.]MDO4609369.1 hypothetical protein [Corynebacterium sp.]